MNKFFILFIFLQFNYSFINAQEQQSMDDLQKDLEACECFLTAMKNHSIVSDKFWAVVEDGGLIDTGTRSKPGDQPKQIWHRCGSAGPPQGLYTHQQVVNNIKKYEPECQRIRNELKSLRNSISDNQGVRAGNKNIYEQPLEEIIFNATANAERGKVLAQTLRHRLEHYKNLEQTLDPALLLSDFNEKMTQIDALGKSFTEEQWLVGIDGAEQIINATKGDGAQGIEALGTISGFIEMSNAKKELRQQQEALVEQKRIQMSRIYWDALDRVNEEIDRYERRAAYAESQKLENYYLSLIKNLECYKERMGENWSPSNYNWLINNCNQPEKPTLEIENKFIAKDQLYLELAEKKYKYYLNNRRKYEGFGGELAPIYRELTGRSAKIEGTTKQFDKAIFENIIESGALYNAGFRNGDWVINITAPKSRLNKIEFTSNVATSNIIDPVSDSEKIDLVLKSSKRAIQGFALLPETNEELEAAKNQIKNIIDILESYKDQEMSKEIKKFLHLNYYSLLGLTIPVDESIRNEYEVFFTNHPLIVKQISKEDKIRFIENFLNKAASESPKLYKMTESDIESQLQLCENSTQTLNRLFFAYSMAENSKFDHQTVKSVFESINLINESKQIVAGVQNNEQRDLSLINVYNNQNINYQFQNFKELIFTVYRWDEHSEEYKKKVETVSKQTIIEGPTSFREAAISFTAAAADINPKAEYFYKLGKYHQEVNSIVTLSYFLMSKEIDPSYFDMNKIAKLEEVQTNVTQEMKEAIQKNDQKYINSFLKTGLFKEIDFEGQDLLTYAISQDQPDAVQLIMNNRIDGKSQEEIDEFLNKAMLKCAYFNSEDTFNRFIELGVNIDFTINGDSPLIVAKRYNSSAIINAIEN